MAASTGSEEGFTLMETLVALAIFSLVAVAVVRAAPQAAGAVYRAAQTGADQAAVAAALDRALAAGPCAARQSADPDGDVQVAWTPVRRIEGGGALYRVEARAGEASASPELLTHRVSAEQCR